MSHKNLLLYQRPDFYIGLALTAILAIAGVLLEQNPWFAKNGLSALTLAILLGMIIGNTVFSSIAAHCAHGVDFSRSRLLRLGIILFGFRITFQDIAQIGWGGALIGVIVIATTFLLAVFLGMRLFRIDRKTAILIGAGSSICGAAAVIATEPIVKGSAAQVTVAVATVVVFGTIAMFLYPLFYSYTGMDEQTFGVYIGSTVHEVAQVVVAGSAVSDGTAATAVIEKMMRVMMLAPFLLILSAFLAHSKSGGSRIVIPWFAVWFVVAAGINSLQIIPDAIVRGIIQLDVVILAMAMAALGLRTRASSLREAGIRPILLAASLFVFLIFGGYAINMAIMNLMV